MEVAPFVEVPGTEERSTELSVRERPFRDCLGDGGFPRSGKPVQPVNRGLSEVPGPEFDLVQNSYPGSLQTTSAFAMQEFGPLCTAEAIEDRCFVCYRFLSGTHDGRR